VPRITRQSIEDVRQRADIVALIGDYTVLKKAGASWRGLSPFAQEKTPSFYVHPDKGFFYCFSTAQGGDLFRFLMLKEGLNFQEAVERAASRFAIPLQYDEGGPSREERSLRALLLGIHETAATAYAAAFNAADAAPIREYWTTQRRFSLATAEDFQIGYAPPDGASLARTLLKAGFAKDALSKCGLFTGMDYAPDPLRWRAKFRGRLIIPIRDAQGRVIAFTARLLPFIAQDERDPSREAKYVNSPETEIFHKSQVLFNLDRAKIAVGDDAPFVLVEGQLDAIRAYSCGVKTAIASQGTAIGAEHLALIHRYSRRVDALLDADRAGQAAALKLLPLAMRAGVEVRVLGVPGGKDPDEYFAAAGPEGWPAVRDNARSAIAFAVRGLLPTGGRTPMAQKLDALQSLFAMIAEAESAIVREDALSEVSRLASIDLTAIRRDFERFAHQRRRPAAAGNNTTANPADADGAGVSDGYAGSAAAAAAAPLNTAEEQLLALLLHHADLARPLASMLDAAWLDTAAPAGNLLNRVTAEITEGDWPGAEAAQALVESEQETNLLARLLLPLGEQATKEDPVVAANRCLGELFRRFVARRRQEISADITALPPADFEAARQLQKEDAELRTLLKKPPALPAGPV
jgi:DNA primase